MHSGSPLYQFMLLFVLFGGGSVMLAFVLLLPGVGNWLVACFAHTQADKMMLRRKGESVWIDDPG